jgi:hypothetical protein
MEGKELKRRLEGGRSGLDGFREEGGRRKREGEVARGAVVESRGGGR